MGYENAILMELDLLNAVVCSWDDIGVLISSQQMCADGLMATVFLVLNVVFRGTFR